MLRNWHSRIFGRLNFLPLQKGSASTYKNAGMRYAALTCAGSAAAGLSFVGFRGFSVHCEETISESNRLQAWQARWDANQIGWHLDGVNPYLLKFWKEVIPDAAPAANGMGPRVLVPLCGKTVDLAFLARNGYRVLGVEGVKQAILDFAKEHGLPIAAAKNGTMHVNLPPSLDPNNFKGHAVLISAGPEESTRREPPPPVIFVEGDWFEISAQAAQDLLPCDVAFDRGSLVAIDPKERGRYAQVMSSMIVPGGKVLLVVVEHDAFADGRLGPPFEVTEDDVKSLFSSNFEVKLLLREDRLQQDEGFRKRGVTRFHECVYVLTKKP